jgi:hypothetical protein
MGYTACRYDWICDNGCCALLCWTPGPHLYTHKYGLHVEMG